MLKKDVDHFRRNLKLDNHLLTIHELLNVYIVKDSSDIYFKQRVSFAMLSRDEQDLFIQNFRRTLMGQIDQKLFPLRFKDSDDLTSQSILYKSLSAESDVWEENMVAFVEKMLEGQPYEEDTVFTFVRGEFVATSDRATASEEGETDAFVNPFILCTINATKMSDSELLFDYVEKEFTYHVEVNPVIDLQAPINGFLFPTFQEGIANVNELLYTTRKAYVLDHFLLDEVLQVEEGATAEDEKFIFSEVVKRVAGDQLNTQKLGVMYEEVHERLLAHKEMEADEEAPTLDYRDVGELLVQSGVQGVENEDIKEAFQSIVEDPVYEVKAENAVPKFTTKSVKVKTKVANFSLRPKDLQYVRQVTIDGKPCLVIEVDEETEIDGFSLIPEVTLTETDEDS